MQQLDVEKAVDAVLDAVAVPLAALMARLRALEERLPEKGDKGDPGEPGQPGEKGKDADPETVKELVMQAVEALQPLLIGPAGMPGEKGEPGASGDKGDDGQPGRDGIGLAAAVLDRDGELVLTMTDGSARSLGQVVGRDGRRGEDGADGKDGRDGFGFEDMTEELADDGRTIIRRYRRGEEVREFRHTFAVVLDRGVFREGSEYIPGDGVTWAGSFWIAQEKTGDKPDDGKGWRLAVKRGRDGRHGKDGEKGERGLEGKIPRNPAVQANGEPGAQQW